MLKITVSRPKEKDKTYWFMNVADALKFLNSINGNEPDSRGPTLRAPAEAGGAWEWVCENCKPDAHDPSRCAQCGRPRPGG